MKIKLLLVVIMILPFSTLYSQTISFEKIKGKWQNYRTEAIDGDTGEKYNLNGKPFKSLWKFNFINGKKVEVFDGIQLDTLNYKIQNNRIFIGNRVFEVKRLEKDLLIVLEYLMPLHENEDPRFRLFFKRIK